MKRYDQIGQTVFGSWTIRKKLGEGSFGRVFEIQREDFGEVYKAALKVITVPQSEAEVQGALEEGMSAEQAEQYFYGVVEDIVREFAIMAKLKGTANVVGYEDHAVIRHEEGIGWDILIRMELLHPLLPYAYAHPFARRDIIRLGIDLCRALELCQKYNVIHRDIKPENIFVSDNGDFKLGDFGIARTIDRTMSGLSKKGTYNYMAPEVYRGSEYGFSVDLYSLGLVLYRLLNKNRMPFLPPAPEPITYHSREVALARRMGGEALPAPVHAQGRLAEIILKACAFEPKERYSSPAQMRQELEAILYDEADAELIYPDGDELALMENQYVSHTPAADMPRSEDQDEGDRTESMFGGGPGADDSLDRSRTESMFGGEVPKDAQRGIPGGVSGETARGVFGEETSRTESIFSTPPAGEKRNRSGSDTGNQSKRSVPVESKKTGRKNLVIGIAAAVLVLAAAGGIFFFKQKTDREAEELARQRTEQYTKLMEDGTALCESDPAAALEHFLEAGELFPEETEPKVAYAYALYCGKEYETCITYIEDELALGKEYDIDTQSRLSEILASAYFEQKDYAAAASFFRLSTAGGDITVAAMRDYGVSLGKLGDFEAADEVLERMASSGADDMVTRYVQAEVDYAREEYSEAESGFLAVLSDAEDEALKVRAMRSLAELYRDCTVLAQLGESPIDRPAVREAELLADGIVTFGLQYDSTLWEMLALAYYEAAHAEPEAEAEGYLARAAECFEQVIELGQQKEYLYANLYTIHYEEADYEAAEEALGRYEEAFPDSYMPHALRGVLLITVENEKSQEERDYTAAVAEYETAGSLLDSDDDTTYYQQLGSLMDQLREGGWIQ